METTSLKCKECITLSNDAFIVMKGVCAALNEYYGFKIKITLGHPDTIREKYILESKSLDRIYRKGFMLLNDMLVDLIPDDDTVKVNKAFKDIISRLRNKE